MEIRMNRNVAAILTSLGATLFSLPALGQIVSADPSQAPDGIYRLEASHSQLLFSILHLGLTQYYGRFDRLSGTLNFDSRQPEKSITSINVDISGIDTPSSQLNAELKGASVFDAARFPQAAFKSTAIARIGATAGTITGDLTLHGVTKSVTFAANFVGGKPDPFNGVYAIGFSATGTIKRTDFGLTGMSWEPMVSDDVTLIIQAMFDQEKR
jgi:polyisoprenoid-binding protein YceI